LKKNFRKVFVFVVELSTVPHDSDEDDDLSDEDVDEPLRRGDDHEEDFEIDPKDERAFNAFMNSSLEPRKTLADLVTISAI
jgi:hypothetical protein